MAMKPIPKSPSPKKPMMGRGKPPMGGKGPMPPYAKGMKDGGMAKGKKC
jgi:hypothetical protein